MTNPDGGTLVGPDAFAVAKVTSGIESEDGGVGATRRFVTIYFDQATVSACTSPNPPFALVEVRVELTDGGFVGPGTWALDGTSVVNRVNYTSMGLASGIGGLGRTGTVVISRLDATSSAGSFTTTLSLLDGGTAPLSGTWDTAFCQ